VFWARLVDSTGERGRMSSSAALEAPQRRRFCLILIKPSHYDDDGYVIQWLRSPIPSNSLAALYGLARDCAERAVLGLDVDLDIHAYDETNTRIRPDRLARMIARAGDGMVMMVGVQSNQFPRALDLAAPLRARAIKVCIGGFHVSGAISMLNGVDQDLDRAKAMGVSLFAGEAEGRLDEVLQDAAAGALKPLYNYMDDLPSLEGTPIPLMAAERAQHTAGAVTSFDAGRGCPYQCSFCTIINVQGRKSRYRSADDIEKIVRVNYAQGLRSFFITDDNFARNKHWEAILDRLIHLRQIEKLHIGFIIQVDTLCHKLPNFVRKCALAGVRRVFYWSRKHQSRQFNRRQKATEQDHRISRNATRLEVGAGDHICWLHPRLSQRHRRLNFARYRRHQARAAGRSAGIFLFNAAAGI